MISRIRSAGKYQVFEWVYQGLNPWFCLNTSKEPFNDVRVRQAFNHAIDREALVQVVESGRGVPAYGPITPATYGYWPGVA